MDSELEERGRGLNASSESYFDGNEGRLGDNKANRPKTYTQFFEEVFPQYLAIGMSYELFWFGDCTLVKAYREANQIEFERKNLYAWLQGVYVYEAIAAAVPALKPPFNKVKRLSPYADKPHDFRIGKMTDKEKKEKRKKEDQAFFDLMGAWMTQVNSNIADKDKKTNGAGQPTPDNTADNT